MSEAFRLGGWGMYPTTLAGLVLVTIAIRYAVAPDPRRRALVRALALLVFLCGCLGFVAGSIRTLIGAAQMASNEVGNVIAGGLGESLENIGLALSLLVLAGIAVAIGTSRTNGVAAKAPLGGAELHGL